MSHNRGSIMAAPPFSFKSEGRKLRRKLQKINTHHWGAPDATTNNVAKTNESRGFIKAALGSRKTDSTRPAPVTAPPRPPAPDMSIFTRERPRRTSGYCPSKATESIRPPKITEEYLPPSPPVVYITPAPVVPELAHLSECRPRSRSSSETISSDGPSTPPSEVSSITVASRQYAKTPVTSIGQLEARSYRHAVNKVPSVERIAQSYRALLESRGSILDERFHDALETLPEESYGAGMAPGIIHPDDLPVETILETSRNFKTEIGSPTSSDGTLVGFEEDTIYFKPISVTPEPFLAWTRIAERRGLDHTARTATPAENPTLQIMLDLLTKELSAAARGSPMCPNTETSALQIWVMIEAYEKLRDQVDRMRLETGHAQALHHIFGVWLQALHAVHGDLAGSEHPAVENDYYEDIIPEAEGVD